MYQKILLVSPFKLIRIFEVNIHRQITLHEPSISHYRREHAPNRKYLPTDLNIQMMYNHFKIQWPNFKCSYELYRRRVQEMNISFVKLGHEECFSCEKYILHEKDSQHKGNAPDELNIECPECVEYRIHKKKSMEAREIYEKDKIATDGISVYSADLQKVIMLPRYESLKEVIFTGRIIAFNESFVPVGTKQKNKKPIAIIWHEGVTGRSKSDIISTFYAFFLRHRDEKHIILWLDNCSAQNKNWALLSFFVFAVNSDQFILEKLEVKYFEPGHTFMSADSFHHQVEMSLKKKIKVYDFFDFEECVRKANSGKVVVVNMTYNNFYDWADHASQYKLKNLNPRPYLNQMVHLQFSRGDFNMSFKTSFSDTSFVQLNFLKANVLKKGFPIVSPRNSDRGISAEKKNGILTKLCPVIPKNRISFWEELPVFSGRETEYEVTAEADD